MRRVRRSLVGVVLRAGALCSGFLWAAFLGAAFLCSGFLCSGAAAQETVAAWPQLREGASARYRTTSVVRAEAEPPAGADARVLQDLRVHTEETHTVVAVDADGTAELRIERSRVHGTMAGGALRRPVAFDTAAEGRMHPVAKGVVDLFRAASVVRVDRTGAVLSVRKVRDDGELADADDHERDTQQFAFVYAPALPIRVGGTWRPARGVHECEAGGCVELATQNELAAADPETLTVATVATDGEPGAEDDADAKHRVTRTLTLSREDGLVVAMRAGGTSRGDGIARPVSSEMVRAEPAAPGGAGR